MNVVGCDQVSLSSSSSMAPYVKIGERSEVRVINNTILLEGVFLPYICGTTVLECVEEGARC